MVTNMPRLTVAQISRLRIDIRRAGSRTVLPRQRNRLAVCDISSEALSPLPDTSPMAKAMVPSGSSK